MTVFPAVVLYSNPLLNIDIRISTNTKLLVKRFKLFSDAAPILHVCLTELVTAAKVNCE